MNYEINSKLKTGLVKYFNHTQGYGFIQDDETGMLIYVQAKNLAEKITKGDEVTFEIESNIVLNAVKVKKI